MKNKKAGVDAGATSTLVLIIALILVLFILFIPPEAREELLENSSSSSSNSEGLDENVLLYEDPGTLRYSDDDDSQYGIGSIYLYETTNAESIDSLNPFIIKNGWFTTKSRTFNFKITDVENTDNVILSLSASKGSGILYIYLNEELVFENELTSLTPEPITLKKSLLKSDNVLRFEVSNTGISFWKANEYQFTTAEIIGDVTDLSGQAGQNTFNIAESDYVNLETSTLDFVPYCSNLQTVGQLIISINDRLIFSAVPICDDPYHQPFDINILKSGSNNIVFSTIKGSYSVEQIEIDLKLKDSPSRVYYFELNESQYEEIEEGETEAWLYIEFINNEEDKKLDININGHMRNIDQEEADYEKDITEWVGEGNNYIELVPRNTVHIINMQVVLEEV